MLHGNFNVLQGICAASIVIGTSCSLSAQPGIFLEKDVEVLWYADGEAPGDEFGYTCNPIGDITGDGVTEFIVSSAYHDAGAPNGGKVYIYDGATRALLKAHVGTVTNGAFGFRVQPGGDLNGDGVPDYVVSGPGVLGTATTGEVFAFSGADHSVIAHIPSPVPNARFGQGLSVPGDINGDGEDDLVIGASRDGTGAPLAGVVRVYSRSDWTTPWREHIGTTTDALFGHASQGLADITNDGVPEYIIGAPGDGPTQGGVAYVYNGLTGSLEYSIAPSSSTAVDFARFFANDVGDLNNDGVRDIFIGDFNDNALGPWTGVAYTFSGVDGSQLHRINGLGAYCSIGFGGRYLGDMDCDGHDDFLTAYLYVPGASAVWGGQVAIFSGKTGETLRTITSLTGNNAQLYGEQFGYDCVRLGDLDGDTVPELLITAGLNNSNGNRAGRAYIIKGELVEPQCYADCDRNTALNIFDYICFGNYYASHDPCADCDGNGSLNVFDYICFGNAYSAGCS
ncbi:MAG: FG-GAP repeat protein [Phycisphaeraceae bacterium]|nr:FG-GAP repeat protein [Phycisphaerales bacterium]MCB9859399.1 FG-GAP repeat protein [Phycisphaeraceae bacterium]